MLKAADMPSTSTITAPFVLLNAFTSKPESGNPAAVVFLPSPGTSYPTEKLQVIAKNLNQPITVFLSPLSEPSADVTGNTDDQPDFAIRWFTVEVEVPLCGHGTLATAKAIFAMPHLVADQMNAKIVSVLKFQTITGSIVSARKLVLDGPDSDVENIQITLPHNPPVPIVPTSSAASKIRSALGKALQKPAEEVDIRFMGHSSGSIANYLLVELGGEETLEGREIMTDALRETGYFINVVTTAPHPSSTENEVFVSRMFAPGAGVPEDHVCGSAHCLLTPYWAQKRLESSLAGSVTLDTPMKALQVSPRRGTLFVSWDAKQGIVKISGEAAIWGQGEVFL